jgi:hypothetical protein
MRPKAACVTLALLLGTATAPLHADEARADEDGGGALRGLDLGVRLGVGGRVDDPPDYTAEETAGLMIGGAAMLRFGAGVSVGLAYEHRRLGAETLAPGAFGTLDLSRDLDALWLELQLDAVRGRVGAVFLRLGLAGVLQSLAASGVAWPAERPSEGVAFRCEGGGALGFGLRAEAGAEALLAGAVRIGGAGGLDGYQLGDEPIDGCAPGAGSALVVGMRAGLAYTILFDP